MNRAQKQRLAWRSAFFLLFVLAPPLDIFRFDLNLGHFILFGFPWTLGIDAAHPLQSGLNIILRGFLPIALVVGAGARASGCPGVTGACTAAGCVRTFPWWR